MEIGTGTVLPLQLYRHLMNDEEHSMLMLQ